METISKKKYKKLVNRTVTLSKGNCRAFVRCVVCGKKSFYDYIPFSLSTPVVTTPCRHSIEHYKSF